MEEAGAAAATSVSHELVPQLRFPPGYRFVPTEEELVDVYLRAKIEGHKLPLQVINDVSILDWQPGSLVEAYKGYGENRWFFFAVREQSSSNKEKEPSRKVRVDGVTATWKATGSVQIIRRRRARSKDAGDKLVVGSKRVLIYNSTDPNENGKWSMHEYILKDHAEIGQYALYSIQRKQHSDTQDNAGNGDMDSEKKKTKKRKRTEKTSTELEGVQLPHPETTTLLAQPPLKPTRKAKSQRKKKPSMQVGAEEEQKQGQSLSQMEPVTPPKKDELTQQQGQSPMQQEQPEAPVADGAPAPIVLSAVPLQAVRVCPPSEPDGMPGASAPTLEEEDRLDDMSQLYALLCNQSAMSWNNQGQEQWPPSLAGSTAFLAAPDTSFVVDHAPFQPYYQQKEDSYGLFDLQNQHLSLGENQSVYYMEHEWQHADQFLPSNTTHLMNSSGGWEQCNGQQRQIHHHHQQQENNRGGAFGVVQDQQPMNHLESGYGHGHDLQPMDEQQQSSSSDDLESVHMDMDELNAFVRGVLVRRDEPPPQDQDFAASAAGGTQEQEGGDDPATLQASGTQELGANGTVTLQSLEHDELQWQLAWLRALNQHVWDGPCSCMICAAGLWHYYFPGP